MREEARKIDISDFCYCSLYETFYYSDGWSHDSKTFSENEFPHLAINENALEEVLKYFVSHTIQVMHYTMPPLLMGCRIRKTSMNLLNLRA